MPRGSGNHLQLLALIVVHAVYLAPLTVVKAQDDLTGEDMCLIVGECPCGPIADGIFKGSQTTPGPCFDGAYKEGTHNLEGGDTLNVIYTECSDLFDGSYTICCNSVIANTPDVAGAGALDVDTPDRHTQDCFKNGSGTPAAGAAVASSPSPTSTEPILSGGTIGASPTPDAAPADAGAGASTTDVAGGSSSDSSAAETAATPTADKGVEAATSAVELASPVRALLSGSVAAGIVFISLGA